MKNKQQNISSNRQNKPHEEGQQNNTHPNSNTRSESLGNMKQPTSGEQDQPRRSGRKDEERGQGKR